MASITADEVLSLLTERGVAFKRYEHPPVSTVEEQVEYCNVGGKGFSKNLLLKDKKGRIYLISALTTTTIDLKILSQRLGLGKGGLRFAPDEVVQAVLQVSSRCVAPFALMNESSRQVALLLDKNFQTVPHIFFHPLTSNMTISIEPSGLDAFLQSIKRTPSYVDLEAVVAVGKDQPPDLAAHVPVDAHLANDPKDISEVLKSNSEQLPVKKAEATLKGNLTMGLQSKDKAGAKNSYTTINEVNIADVQSLVSNMLRKTVSAVISEISVNTKGEHLNDIESDVARAVSRRLSPEFEGLVVMFKNTAYTQGFFAGIGSKSLDR
ncbi:hypothetical protein O6H91_03G079100 [Diphasiastrum complanatum]|uniref:Uncharacterized protein n=1 Tax=Diphasiastrum complanatum TaxID=34168 RepID=A0ACC2E8B9_DIPCM|nr:hypothetical protein O6H91_03G079100 [Diphasiastrum complanatum]